MYGPTRPITPYISLDHPYTKDFYTNTRLQTHLRRAGLLNKNGEILTQAEYDSLQKDVAIGRENKRKIEDAIVDILNDMAREHWGYARDQMESLRKDLLNQFRRIENQYRRRVQPIVIRRKVDGKFQMDHANTTSDDSLNITRRSFDGSTATLPSILKNRSLERSKSVPPSDITPLTELEGVREELNTVRIRLIDVEKKSDSDIDSTRSVQDIQKIEHSIANIQTKLIHIQEQQKKFDETLEQEKKQRTNEPLAEHFIQFSNAIQGLTDRLTNLETSFNNLPKGLTQDDVETAIQKNEEKTVSREHVLESLIHNFDTKTDQMQIQLDELLTNFKNLPNPLTLNEINQLIANEIKNLEQMIQHNSDEARVSTNEGLNKVQLLEMRLNQVTQTNKLEITRTMTDTFTAEQESIPPLEYLTENASTTLDHRQETESGLVDLNLFEERLSLIENYLRNTNDRRIEELEQQVIGNFGQIESLQTRLEDLNDRKIEHSKITQMIDDTERKLQDEIRKIPTTAGRATPTPAPANQKTRQCVDTTLEQRLNKKINDLRRTFEDNQRDLKKMETNFNNLQTKFNEQLATKAKTQVQAIPAIDKVPSKELQAIMPFIELLPTFDMFFESEWN